MLFPEAPPVIPLRKSMDELHFYTAGSSYASTAYPRQPSQPHHSAIEDSDGCDMDVETSPETGAHPTSTGKKAVKGMLRRASISLHTSLHGLIQRRASFAGGNKAVSAADDHLDSYHTAGSATGSHFLPNRLLRPSHAYGHSHSHAHSTSLVHCKQPTHTTQQQPLDNPDYRPVTSHGFPSWRRVRQVASFRHSRVPYVTDQRPAVAFSGSQDEMPDAMVSPLYTPCRDPAVSQSGVTLSSSAPLPGSLSSMTGPPVFSSGPPVIPLNTGGAARAAAAAAIQNDVVQMQLQMHQLKWPAQEEYGNDRESGIGIAVTSAGSDSANEADVPCALNDIDYTSDSAGACTQLDISKVDFVAHLPIELGIVILSQLDALSLAAASRVSRTWHSVTQNQHIWRESFFRGKTATYATSGPVPPGAGLGVPTVQPGRDWQKIYRAKAELDRCWRAGKTCPVYLSGHTDSIYCLQFDEHKIITGSRDKTIRIWDMKTFACRLIVGPPSAVTGPYLLHDADGAPTHFVTDAWHARSSYSVPETVSFSMYHSASILCLQYDDEILVTGSSDGSCIIYSIKDGYRPLRQLKHHGAAVLDLCFDERHIVTCSKDTTICVWDRATGAMLKQLRGHSGPVNAVQMRGNTVVSCSGDFRVMLWNIETGRAIRECTGHTKGLACSQFSEDGRFVASAGNDRVIRIWDANTGDCVREMKAHDNLVRSLHIDSISGRLVSASYDRDIKVFDMETGLQLLDFPGWHQSWVLSAKSDYRRIISTGQDPKILVMDFGADIAGIELLESTDDRKRLPARFNHPAEENV